MGPIHTFDDVIDMLRRRAGVIIAVFVVGCIASVLWALSLTHVYRSSEVIQIKLPKISNSLAPPTVEGTPGHRLQLIQQQLMARENLTELIEKYNLYAELTDLPMTEKVDLLRRSVTIIGAQTPHVGYRDGARISGLTFIAEMEDPADAQAVAREFSERTRTLAAAQRREQSREALEFFQRQEESLIRNITDLEAERVEFRVANDLSLSGSLGFRRREIDSLNNAILAIDRDITANRLAREQVNPNARASTIARQQAELDATFESLTARRDRLNDQRDALTASLQTTPEIDRELDQFARRLEQLQDQLELVTARRNEAEVGASIEADEGGEKMIVLEEAELPAYPFAPSRKKYAAIGGLISLALALVTAYLLELRRPVLRTAEQMVRETGLMPVISIADLSPPKKHRTLGKVWRDRLKKIFGTP